MRQWRQNQPATPAALTWASGGAQALSAVTVAAPQQTASPIPLKNERGTFEFTAGEKIAAFILGALVWFALAYGDNRTALASFASFGGGAGDGVSRLPAFSAHDGFIGPMAFSASVGGVFFARLLRGVPVRGLSRWACFLLCLPLFQVFSIACVACVTYDSSGATVLDVISLMGILAWIIACPISVSGGLHACDRARADKREFAASVLIPLLWLWQLFCFTPWSWKLIYNFAFN